MYGMWSPWLAARVAGVCDELEDGVTVADALSDFTGPEGWHVCLAEVLASNASLYGEEWPMEDAGLLGYVEREGSPDVVAFDVSAILLQRRTDGALCLTVGHGAVAEPFGYGLTITRAPDENAFTGAWQLPVVTYMGADYR